jgi:hypothetical protein
VPEGQEARDLEVLDEHGRKLNAAFM